LNRRDGESGLFDLKGKVAVVTGGAGVIGTAVCHGFAIHGADVAVVDIKGAAAQQLADEIAAAYGTRAIAIECDVADAASVAGMAETVWGTLGGIDILLNNAATQPDRGRYFTPFEDYTLETWREVMSVNVDGMFLVAQAVGSRMAERGRGSIIQTASIYGISAPDHRIYEGSKIGGRPISLPAVYATSKAAVIGLTKYLATYWAARGVRVNAIAPGGIEGKVNDAFRKRYSARVPLGRMAKPNDVVGATVLLASDASSYITGQLVVVDGGWTTW
jgi:NAD(P)-dependent dehydrogenase (short-subunit alcohol dehydrogenase family)